MKKNTIYHLLFLVFILTGFSLSGQEVLVPLQGNPVLSKLSSEAALTDRQNRYQKSATASEPVTLPFYDDFTGTSVYPNTYLWSDSNVYINSDFAYRSFNRGVATFDALDSAGNIYSKATYAPFEADRLTSNDVRLDSLFVPQKRSLTIGDSVYLSFYYQPQGLGNDPQPGDSILLQFLTKITDTTSYWKTMWSSPGMKLDTFFVRYGTYSRRVNIPITDSAAYFRSDFRFRFMAYASLAGDMLPSWQSSMDHWNVDAVKLDINGHYNDSTESWIGFAEKAPSMLKDFYSVPYTQYSEEPTAFMTDTLTMFITNRDSIVQPARYGYKVFRSDGTEVSSYNGGNSYINPFLTSGLFSDQVWAKPPVKTIIPIDPFGVQDSAVFTVRHVLKGDEAGMGDTIYYEQKMTNFYAYDDGVPELGYGLTPSGAQLAVRFSLTRPDTLRAVRLYFNKVVDNANQQYFSLKVWDDNNGIPGKELFVSDLIRPTFSDRMFCYTQVNLDEIVPVRSAFYVGWQQTTNDNLNIGFDRSRDNSRNNLFNTDGNWYTSQFPGAIMIRPVVGKEIIPIPSVSSDVKSSGLELSPSLWSHTGDIRFKINGVSQEDVLIELYDLSGRLVYSEMSDGAFTPTGCGQGIYIVKASISSSGQSFTKKLMITR